MPCQRADAADRHDVTTAALHHLGRDRAAHQDRRQQVAIQDGVDVVEADEHGVVGVGLARVGGAGALGADVAAGGVNQDVDARERFVDFVDGAIDRGGLTQVAVDGQGRHVVLFGNCVGHAGQRVGLVERPRRGGRRAVDHDVSAQAGQVVGDGAA